MPFNQDSLLAAAAAGPSLDPQSLLGIAQTTSDPSLAAENAQATHAYAQTLTAVNTLRKHDAGTQNKVWQSLSSSEQQMYLSAGYAVPAKPAHTSLFGDVVGAVGGGLAKVLETPTHLATTAVGEGLHYLGAPLRQVQHAYRAAALVTDYNETGGAGRWSLGTASDWAKAWRESTHGEQTFLPSKLAKLNDQYGADTVNLAKRIAGGTSPDQIVLAAAEPDRAALAQRLQSDANLHDAVSQLQLAKISFGRRLVGEHLFRSNPALASKLSGAFDATADIFADPIVWGGKIAKAAELAPYIVRDADAIGQALAKPGAQRMLTSAADALREGGAGTLIRRFPKFSTIAQQLVDEGVTTADHLGEWFKGVAGQKAILEGKVGGVASAGEVLVPKLSRSEAALTALREKAGEAIDWGTTHHIPISRSLGRITALSVPLGDKLTADSPEALTYIQRIADYALGAKDAEGQVWNKVRSNELVTKFAAATDQSEQFGIYKGLLSEVMDGMKVPQEWRDWWFNKLEGNVDVHNYGLNDSISLGGQDTKVGFTAAHVMDQGWSIPDFRELRIQADKAYVYDKLYGGINGEIPSSFMRIWKPAQLLRIGFPIRTAGEELVAAMLREGPVGIVRARLAASSLKDGDLAAVHPLSAALDLFTRHLPDKVVEKINAPADFVGEVLGDRARRALRFTEGKLAGQQYVDAAKASYRVVSDALPEEVSAVHQHGAGFLDNPETVARMTREGREVRPAYLKPSGDYRGYVPTETMYTQVWHKALTDYSKDPFMAVAFEHASEGEAAQIQAVIDTLQNPAHDYIVKKAVRSVQTADGRLVGEGATSEEALRDWANVIVQNANHVTSDAAGNRFDDILRAVSSGDAPKITALNEIPHDIRPVTMTGPDMLPTPGLTGRFKEISDNGFDYLGRMMNWIAREPIFVHNMATSMKEVEGFRSLYQGSEFADQHLSEVAFQRALNKTIPFIHDPKVRSQFAEDARNLAPFLFAQEQFFKRWALTAVHSPESFREAQLSMMGLRHAGFVHKDQSGNDYFVYPGAGMTQKVLSKAASAILGHDVTLPLPVQFTGQVRFATPGTERLGAPAFGPLVAIPMRAMTSRFPELAELEQAVVGERGAGRPFWEQVVPASAARLVHTLIDNPETSPQMHSAMLQAVQYLEATGHGLKDSANPLEREHYLDRIKSWTRILMLTRTLFGFAAPAAPELQLDPSHLHQEFTSLLGQLPIQDATREFIRRHPDATPFTVFQTKSESGAPLPATTDAMHFMNQHEAFLRTYPQAGAWFIPQAPKDSQFSMPAYREQLALELRKKKSIDEFYKDIKFSEAAGTYFDTRDARDAALKQAAGNSGEKKAITLQWTQFHDEFVKSHPVFEEQLLSPDGQLRRQHTVTQLRQALSDPNLPDSPQNTAIRTMVDTFDGLQQFLTGLKGQRDRSATDARKGATAQFVDWAHSYIVDHPEVRGMYDSVFRLQVGDNA